MPEDKKQANFTDPESRIMGNRKTGFVQGYNGQIAVDAEELIVVATAVTQSATDTYQLLPMVKAAKANTKKKPKRALADSGYRSEENFRALEKMGIDAHVALGKGETAAQNTDAGPATQRMHRKRRTKRGRMTYKKRKTIVEAPFGWIKSVLGFRSFSMRGLDNVTGEWNLVNLALNLRRMSNRMVWV